MLYSQYLTFNVLQLTVIIIDLRETIRQQRKCNCKRQPGLFVGGVPYIRMFTFYYAVETSCLAGPVIVATANIQDRICKDERESIC